MELSGSEKLINSNLEMDPSDAKTLIQQRPERGPEGSGKGNALPEEYILEGRYFIEKVLGSGGFGITYLAKHRYLNDIWVAIKEYLPAGAAVRDSDSRVHVISEQHSKIYSWGLERFLDEARLLRQFQHPNIVSVSDYFEANNTAYLVMDYVKGRSIQTELDAGKQFDENKIRRIVYPLLTALQLIHRDGLYHRDISPDNILLREEDGSPVLIDFGSARYEMRMRGADQDNADQGHTPTSIFKQGYSPIEQYDGTPQGPYTDIYALGATIYRTAFGVRPIEAMTRSGELRMTKTDPLIPASEKGKGRFSGECLRAIDAALQLDASDRPQTTNEWLDIFGLPKEPDQPEEHAATHPRQSGWRKALTAGMLVVTVATAGYFGYQWYEEKKDIQILPSDIPGLISHATAKLVKAPFSEEAQNEAKRIYLQILTQDNGNIRALAGYSAANLLRQFNNSIKEEDRPKAVVLLNKAESELKLVGIDRKALEPGWQRIERLNQLISLRAALYRAPLDPDNWPSIEVLIKNISLLPDSSALAKSGNQGLQALTRVNDFISKNQFAKAREHLVIAEERLSLLGLGSLDQARSAIDKSEARFAAERLKKITALLQTAEKQLQTKPLTNKVLNGASTTYDEILKLDGRQSKALAGRVLIEKLVTAFTTMDQSDFETGRYALDSAERIATSAGIAPDAVNQARDQLTQRLHTWTIAKNRTKIKALFAESKKFLTNAPLNESVIARVKTLYQQALTISTEAGELKAEKSEATSGIALVEELTRIHEMLANSAFEQARKALNTPQIRSLSDQINLGPLLVMQAEKSISETEIDWNDQQATEILHKRYLLRQENLDAAQFHLDRILALNPERAQTSALSDAVAALQSVVSARNDNDYNAAAGYLQQAQTSLRASNKGGDILAAARELIEREATAWNLQQREEKIAAILDSAYAILRDQEFSSDTLSQAKQVFLKVRQLQENQTQALYGIAMMSTLEDFMQALADNAFDKANDLLEKASTQAQEADFDPEFLNKATTLLSDTRANWQTAQTKQRINDLLNKATSLINETALDAAVLNSAEKAYQEAVNRSRSLTKTDVDIKQISSGLEIVTLLKAFKAELANKEFEATKETVTQLRTRLTVAKLDESIADRLSATAIGEEVKWRINQARDYILSGVWSRDRNFATAKDQYVIVRRMRPDQPGVESSLLGIESLNQLFRARDQRDYPQAIGFLTQAVSYFADADIPKETFTALSQQLQDEQQRWARLSQERNLIAWTGNAIREMSRSPYSEQAWERIESFADKILSTRHNDERGLAVKRALDLIRQAKQAIDDAQFDAARNHVEQARSELSAIGLRKPLQDARDIIDSEMHKFRSLQLTAATTTLSKDKVSNDDLHAAISTLQSVVETDTNNPTAQTSIKVIEQLIEARAAATATRYREAVDKLKQAGNILASTPASQDPLPVLRDLHKRTQQRIAIERPSPGEIYPVISIALRTIADAPLKKENLDTAEKLLRNVLGLQADEHSALVGLQAIKNLRTSLATLSDGRIEDARATLQQAQQHLLEIGLAPTTLQSAWRAIDQASATERTQ